MRVFLEVAVSDTMAKRLPCNDWGRKCHIVVRLLRKHGAPAVLLKMVALLSHKRVLQRQECTWLEFFAGDRAVTKASSECAMLTDGPGGAGNISNAFCTCP